MAEEQSYPTTQETVQRSIMQSDRQSVIREIKSDSQIEEIWHRLLGERWDGKKWYKDPELTKDSLTPLGAWKVAEFALFASSLNTQFARLDEKAIDIRICFRMREFARMIGNNLSRYGIRNRGMIAELKSFIKTNDWVVFSQGQGGHITKFLKGTLDEHRVISAEKEKKKKILGIPIS